MANVQNFIISAVMILMQISWSNGNPANTAGVSAFAYQDTNGNRYGGIYNNVKDFPYTTPDLLTFSQGAEPTAPIGLLPPPLFISEFLSALEKNLQQVFRDNYQNQNLALEATYEALESTNRNPKYNIPKENANFADYSRYTPDYNMAGYADEANYGFPNFANLNNAFGNPFNAFGTTNNAFASAVAGPDFVHQVAGISPLNSQEPNINVKKPANAPETGMPQFRSVYSSSFAKSVNVNGKEETQRGAETYVNDNGKITKYKVHS